MPTSPKPLLLYITLLAACATPHWGRHLAAHGFAAAVLTMPTSTGHAASGKAIDNLLAYLLASPQFSQRLDPRRLAFMAHSVLPANTTSSPRRAARALPRVPRACPPTHASQRQP